MTSPNNKKENINPSGAPSSGLNPLAPVFGQRDPNIPERPALTRTPSPSKNIASTIAPQQEAKPPEMAYKTYNNVRFPADDPPYEDEPDFAAAPPHFDASARITSYWSASDNISQNSQAYMKFRQGFSKATGQHIGLCRAVTESARTKNPNNPTRSQPFFQIHVSVGPDKWSNIRATAQSMIEEHFPEAEYPRETHPYLKVPKIRFFANDFEPYSKRPDPAGASGQPSTPTPIASTMASQPLAGVLTPSRPAAGVVPQAHETPGEMSMLHSTPDSLPKTTWVSGLRKPTLSSRLDIPSRQHQVSSRSEGLLGASVGLYQRRADAGTGTLGGIFLLIDLKKRQYIKDANGNNQRFGLSNHHVLQPKSDVGLLSPKDADERRMVVASVSQRDRENIYYSAKGAILAQEQNLKNIKKRLERYGPGIDPEDPLLDGLTADERKEAEDLLHLHGKLTSQVALDKTKIDQDQLPHEEALGTVFLASGRQAIEFSGQTAEFDPPNLPVSVDYGFIRILPEHYPRCHNTIPKSASFPRVYPVVFDRYRAHKTIMGVSSLRPDKLVVKVGSASGITFGKIMPERLSSGMMADVTTDECVAEPTSAANPVAVNGDSGAAVLDSDGCIVGIVTAGRREEKLATQLPFNICITPFQVIQEHLRDKFGLMAVPFKGYLPDPPIPQDLPQPGSSVADLGAGQGLPKTVADLSLDNRAKQDPPPPPMEPSAAVTDIRVDHNGDFWYNLRWEARSTGKSFAEPSETKKGKGKQKAGAEEPVATDYTEWFPHCAMDSKWTQAIEQWKSQPEQKKSPYGKPPPPVMRGQATAPSGKKGAPFKNKQHKKK